MAKVKHKQSATSDLSQALVPYFDALPPDEFSTKSCPAKSSCTLAAGIEHLFAYLTAHEYLESAREDGKEVLPCQFIYMPHSTAEKGGFDLSLGHFAGKRRVLLMHKLERHEWCDGTWTWKSSKDAKAHGQIVKLLDNYLEEKGYLPFLALHVCYCVHEYRRMGSDAAGVQVPAFSDATRSIFVNLVPILKDDKWKDRFAANEVEIQLHHPQGTSAVQAALVACNDGKKERDLKAVDLPAFLALTKKHLGT